MSDASLEGKNILTLPTQSVGYGHKLLPDLTRLKSRPNIRTMANNTKASASNQALTNLENRVNELISVCEHLKDENTELRNENSSLLADRGQLMANRDKVRTQVEAMIGRLKAMESS